MLDPKSKCYAIPDAEQPPDSQSSHGMMLDLVGRDKRVVEFGCATGYMSRWLIAAGCRVTGVEVDPVMAAQARAICDEVIVADLDTRRIVDLLQGSAYDVAIFGDVLEHLRDPWRVLDETRYVLAEGGFVVISIPNIAHGNVRLALLHGEFDYQDLGLLDNTHLRFFTLKTVRELCLRAGYQIERTERTKAALFATTDTMPDLDPALFDPALIGEIASDPEHDTFQFIVRALPQSDEQRLEALVASNSDLTVRLKRASAESAKLRTELAVARERAEVQAEQELLLVERSGRADREAEGCRLANERVVALEGEIERLGRNVERLELALDAERLKTHEIDETLRETVAMFLNHADAELEAVRAEISQVDRAIHTVQNSWFWKSKLRLGKLVPVVRSMLSRRKA